MHDGLGLRPRRRELTADNPRPRRRDEGDPDHREPLEHPAELLKRWGGWKAVLKGDLLAASQSVSLDDLIPTAMQSLERVEVVVAGVRQAAERRAARSVLRAADRVETMGGLPCLFEVHVRHPDEPLIFSPMPLPVEQAYDVLQ
jgi:hypothetical protein